MAKKNKKITEILTNYGNVFIYLFIYEIIVLTQCFGDYNEIKYTVWLNTKWVAINVTSGTFLYAV